jgi:hypothetical protein
MLTKLFKPDEGAIINLQKHIKRIKADPPRKKMMHNFRMARIVLALVKYVEEKPKEDAIARMK